MYKETLPKGCPAVKAAEDEKTLYRICAHKDNVLDNYLPYTSLYPHIEDYKNKCRAYSISLFDKKETAISYSKRNPKLGGHVAEISVNRTHGRLLLTNESTGHYSLWLYKTFDCATLGCKIETIHAD